MGRPTRLYEFEGGVLEVYDYGDDSEKDGSPGVYLELYGSPPATDLDLPSVSDDTDMEAS
ncbi:hypothetical protein [Nocardia sp. NPDC051570]|uniref:hypothetical protein n=1 Tax=Nocardia sp. NPDC051570 TaxID=3364324 RepID=UPI0037AFD9DC